MTLPMTTIDYERVKATRAPVWQRQLIRIPEDSISCHHSSLTDYLDRTVCYSPEGMRQIDSLIEKYRLGADNKTMNDHYCSVLIIFSFILITSDKEKLTSLLHPLYGTARQSSCFRHSCRSPMRIVLSLKQIYPEFFCSNTAVSSCSILFLPCRANCRVWGYSEFPTCVVYSLLSRDRTFYTRTIFYACLDCP